MQRPSAGNAATLAHKVAPKAKLYAAQFDSHIEQISIYENNPIAVSYFVCDDGFYCLQTFKQSWLGKNS